MTSSHPTPAPCQWISRLATALDRRSAPRLALLFLCAILARGRRTGTAWIRAATLRSSAKMMLPGRASPQTMPSPSGTGRARRTCSRAAATTSASCTTSAWAQLNHSVRRSR